MALPSGRQRQPASASSAAAPLPDGSSTAVHYPDLVDDDRTLAKNLAAIFYDKPVPVDATQPKTRVQIKKPEKKK